MNSEGERWRETTQTDGERKEGEEEDGERERETETIERRE